MFFIRKRYNKNLFLNKNHYENKIFHTFATNKQALWRKKQYRS